MDKELLNSFRKAFDLLKKGKTEDMVCFFNLPDNIETEEEAESYIKKKMEEIIDEKNEDTIY